MVLDMVADIVADMEVDMEVDMVALRAWKKFGGRFHISHLDNYIVDFFVNNFGGKSAI